MIISKELSFEAAHMLSNYDGKCANLHGHSYHVCVEVIGDIDPKTGMVVDYNYLKDYFERCDHAIIFSGDNVRNKAEQELFRWASDHGMRRLSMPDDMLPTAENMSSVFQKDLLDCLREKNMKHIRDVHVTISETRSSNATSV